MSSLALGPAARLLPAAPAASQSVQAAVIDIGSNSVRMVIYRCDGRAYWPIFNEKTLAGLGRGVAQTGALDPEGVASALATLRRFRQIIDAREVAQVTAFATAAVRDAEDGTAFRKRVRDECGFSIKVLSGSEEARLTALGVVAGGADGDFLVGDLGGSSLELSRVSGGEPSPGETLKLGPLAVMAEGEFKEKPARKAIESEFARAAAVFDAAPTTLYAVGGAWRNLARIDMMLRDYPLNVLHHYEMPRAEALKMAEFAIGQSPASLSEIPGASSRRAPTLPYAAYLLKTLIERAGIERVVVSAYGVREGALFNRLPKRVRREEPLLASAVAFATRMSGAPHFGAELADWAEPVFLAQPSVFAPGRDAVLLAAAASLSDIGAAMHPDHRALLVADQVLYAPFAGLGHAERCFLAAALHHRYAGKTPVDPDSPMARLLTAEQMEAALNLGLALRLGAALSARTKNLLARSMVSLEGGVLRLTLDEGARELAADSIEKRLGQLADALGVERAIEVAED